MSGRPAFALEKRSLRSAYHATANRTLTYPSASVTTLQPSIIGLRSCAFDHVPSIMRLTRRRRRASPSPLGSRRTEAPRGRGILVGSGPLLAIVLEAARPVQRRLRDTLRGK